MASTSPNQTRLRGFTLTELLVAVTVLLVVILAIGRIFGAVSKVVKSGEANAAILQETAAIESELRKDLATASPDGFLIVNCTAVRNDVNVSAGGPLLDPRRASDAWLRCDQLAFLSDKLAVSRQGSGFSEFEEIAGGRYVGDQLPVPQSTLSRIYYGHGIQFPYLPATDSGMCRWYQSENAQTQMYPWYRPDPSNAAQEFAKWPNLSAGIGSFNATQPDATDWTLARQELLIVDDKANVYGGGGDYDNNDERYYLSSGGNRVNAAATRANEWDLHGLLGPDAATSRVDVCSVDLARIQMSFEQYNATDPPNSSALGNLLFGFWPRAEKWPTVLDQNDAMTTMSTLASNCSSFEVDWTWANGTGAETGTNAFLRGVQYDGGFSPYDGDQYQRVSTPWFGLDSGAVANGVRTATNYPGITYLPPMGSAAAGVDATSPNPTALSVIESWNTSDSLIHRYTAVFGLNQHEPFVRDGAGNVAFDFDGNPMYRTDYTPWPSALRISMVVHDPDGTIEGGRRVEFTLPLPRGVQDLPED